MGGICAGPGCGAVAGRGGVRQAALGRGPGCLFSRRPSEAGRSQSRLGSGEPVHGPRALGGVEARPDVRLPRGRGPLAGWRPDLTYAFPGAAGSRRPRRPGAGRAQVPGRSGGRPGGPAAPPVPGGQSWRPGAPPSPPAKRLRCCFLAPTACPKS